MTKMVLAFLSIGSIGYFWFDKPAAASSVFEDITDLESPQFKLQVGPRFMFWDTDRAVALTQQQLQHAIECMGTYMPLDEKVAESIFGPYLQGLALLGKSDVHVSTDHAARLAFIASLRAALLHYGEWDGNQKTFDGALHGAFSPIITEEADRKQVFAALQEAPTSGPISEMTITAKHLADLFLVRIARARWADTLKNWDATSQKSEVQGSL